jgi:hypothetical protein
LKSKPLASNEPSAVPSLAGVPARAKAIVDNLFARSRAGLREQARITKAAEQNVQITATIAENNRKATHGEDTNRTRLLALQASLDGTLAWLGHAPPDAAAFFDQPIADLKRAQNSVALALEYLTLHPEAEPLVAPRPVSQAEILGFNWQKNDLSGHINAATRNDCLPGAGTMGATQPEGLPAFMGYPALGIPRAGEIGGNRDFILRDVGLAENDLARSLGAFLKLENGGNAAAPAARTSPLASTSVSSGAGSISGVVSTRGVAFNAVISLTAVNSTKDDLKLHTDRNSGYLSEAIPCTISGSDGRFLIRNVLPGVYAVTVGNRVGGSPPAASNWTIVEVRLGAETKVPGSLAPFKQAPMGGG